MPEFKINRNGQKKKSKELEDIRKALVVLRGKKSDATDISNSKSDFKVSPVLGSP